MGFLNSMFRLAGTAAKGATAVATAVATAPAKVAGDLASSLVDNAFRDPVDEPALGSVVKHYLWGFEHTGIYVGNGEIVHWTSNSEVEKCSPKKFKEGGGSTFAYVVYVSCRGTEPVGSPKAAEYALSKVGQGAKERGEYKKTSNNCHMFVIECLTGEKCEESRRLTEPSEYCIKYLNADNWRVWKGTNT
ncbi:lecithin retinol acyltransferase family protein [Helicobacter bizzozeronii]|uniref:lecithin retinol acyltransferase family protein n=1 Tax=Helicobacter bizzozeronii TaxID=56877 RepID=UPI000CF12B78|nr:lecithin retinol acyltransferase family protein [Helicobacter bizzozeronii]